MSWQNHWRIQIGTLVFLWLGCVGLSGAQTPDWQWRNLTPTSGTQPDARRNGAAIYDSQGKRVIIFGGGGNTGDLNDTWAFDPATSTWTKLATTGTPPSTRHGFDAVYDATGHQLVIYNGQGAGLFNDTWTLNLTTLQWRDVSPANDALRPKRRYGSAGVFDPVSRSLVSFAGFTSEAGRFQDTQSFGLANNSWTDWTPAGTKPQVRCLLTGAYDKTNRRFIIYGGQRSGPLGDLWSFDLATRTWENLSNATTPSARYFTTSFVDAAGNFIFFGGQTNSGNSAELWAYNLSARAWNQLNASNGPSARNGAVSAYDEASNRWFVFGGTGNGNLNDIWELARQRQPVEVATVSAASYARERIAPESIVALFGANLASGAQAAATNPLPTTLQNVSVRVKDSAGMERTASLFYVSPGQINFLVPAGTANGTATINVYDGATLIGTGTQTIAALAPGIFTANGDGRGAPGAILFRVFEDFSHTTEVLLEFDTASNRWVSKLIDLGKEKEEVYLVLYGTGWRFNSGLNTATATIGGVTTPVSYAGAQGGLFGLDQINMLIPRALISRGEVEVALTIGGIALNPVRIRVK
ncbi:MAG: hypothetical protein HOP19_27395 [Acidobacteria bacterium]|nr:hypothetical protein [Acidobacteriota bacterium]